jgi:uncharacterized YigZ family protein
LQINDWINRVFDNSTFSLMTISDTYKTVRSTSKGIFRDRGSRFIAFAIPVHSADEVKPVVDSYRKEYHDARHHCYAYLIGHDKNLWRTNDDGEPSGTAGKPILGQINSNGLTNILIVVIRYFGGTLLGVSGLINAYRRAAAEAILNSEIIECIVKDYYRLKFPYSSMNEVMKVLKDENLDQSEQIFELECSIKIGFRLSVKEHVLARFRLLENLAVEYIETS